MPKIKNIIIFTVIGMIFVSIYIFFIKKSPSDTATLISATSSPVVPSIISGDQNSVVAQEFLTLLLGVKNVRLDDAIFSSNAFMSLRDSNIILTPDGSEGRPNPFAPLGVDNIIAPPAVPVISESQSGEEASTEEPTDQSSIENDIDGLQSLLEDIEGSIAP
ncbi:MAG: hypothetical protein WD963_00350 [Candidatus Paceibacterota bacterium]